MTEEPPIQASPSSEADGADTSGADASEHIPDLQKKAQALWEEILRASARSPADSEDPATASVRLAMAVWLTGPLLTGISAVIREVVPDAAVQRAALPPRGMAEWFGEASKAAIVAFSMQLTALLTTLMADLAKNVPRSDAAKGPRPADVIRRTIVREAAAIVAADRERRTARQGARRKRRPKR